MARRANGEGTIYREKSTGRWVGAITVEGRRRKVKAGTRDEARRRLDEVKRNAHDGRSVGDGNMTVNQLIALYDEKALTTRGRSIGTIDGHRWALKVAAAAIGTKRLRTLTVEDVEAALSARDLSRSSAVKVRSVLAQALQFGERRRLVTHNVARIAELPAKAPPTKEGRALTVEQAQALLVAAADDRLRALWVVMLGLGLRPGEATGLTWADVDLTAQRLHVRRSLKIERGKFVLDERLKTSRSRRTLDMPPFVTEAIRAHRRLQRIERMAMGTEWSSAWPDLVFTTTVGTPLLGANLRRSFAHLTDTAGLGRWHPHELRHSTASILSDAGVPLELVADVLGHDGTRMTALVYRHAITPSVSAGAIPMQTALGDSG